MAKLCTAGVRGPYSYVILNNVSDVVVAVKEDDREIITTHLDMDVAERWVDKHLDSLVERNYEVD
jgi:hypothetical protein